MDLLDSSPVCVLTGKEFLPKEGMTFATQVAQFFEEQGGIANSPFGTVVLDKKGVQNSKQHGNSRIKSASFAAVKDVLEKGVVIKPLDYYGTNDKKQMTGMIAAPIQIADEKYVCVVVVIANTELQRLYVHESFLTKNLQEVAASNLVPRSNTSSPQPYGEVAKVLHNFLISKQIERNNAEDTENNIKTENRQYKMKQRIRLTEGDLHRIIRKCVNEALEKPFRTAETVGPFVNNRAQFLNLRTKKEQMDSDWADLRHSGDYPSNPNILNRRFWESRQRKRNVGLTEFNLHKIIKNVVNETLGGSSDDNMTAFESSHVNPNSRVFTVIANFYDYTYCFKEKIVDTFDNYNEAKEFALEKIRDKDFMYDLAEEAYAEMEDDDETSIDDINFEIFDGKTSIDSPHACPKFVTKGYASLQHS